MEHILQNQTIRTFIQNFQLVDQTLIIQDLIIIGIQTVLSNLKPSSSISSRDSLDERSSHRDNMVSEIAQLKQEISKINQKLGKDGSHQATKPWVQKLPNNIVKIVTHQENKPERRSPRKEVTGKVTQQYPEGKVHVIKSKDHFRHHLDDSEMKQTFTYYEPPRIQGSSKPKKMPAQKDSYVGEGRQKAIEAQQNAYQIANVSQNDIPMKQKYTHSSSITSKQKKSPKKETVTNKRQEKKAPIFHKPPRPARNVESKIKDLIDFDKRNSRNVNFNQQNSSQKKTAVIQQDNLMSFKKIKEDKYREYQQSESSIEISRQEFSPYKKDDNMLQIRQRYQMRKYDEIASSLSGSSSSKDIISNNDSEYSMYENNQEDMNSHRCGKNEAGDSQSYSGLQSSNSSRFPNKAVGKISRKK